MDDEPILSRIEALVDEEHALVGREESDAVRSEAPWGGCVPLDSAPMDPRHAD